MIYGDESVVAWLGYGNETDWKDLNWDAESWSALPNGGQFLSLWCLLMDSFRSASLDIWSYRLESMWYWTLPSLALTGITLLLPNYIYAGLNYIENKHVSLSFWRHRVVGLKEPNCEGNLICILIDQPKKLRCGLPRLLLVHERQTYQWQRIRHKSKESSLSSWNMNSRLNLSRFCLL